MLIEVKRELKSHKRSNTNKQKRAEICFCFGALGVEYFMNLEPEENNNKTS